MVKRKGFFQNEGGNKSFRRKIDDEGEKQIEEVGRVNMNSTFRNERRVDERQNSMKGRHHDVLQNIKQGNDDQNVDGNGNQNILGRTVMSYASVTSLNSEQKNDFQFKNMCFKDPRSDQYVKRGIWWIRGKGLCVEDYLDYFTQKYGKGALEMIYQVAYRRIEAFTKTEALAFEMSEEIVSINDTETRINLLNSGPMKFCIKNIMPWITLEEIKNALNSYGEVIVDTIKYIPLSRNIGTNGEISSGKILLYVNRKPHVQMPFYITPKIGQDYHRWYIAPMNIKCYNCGEWGHWLRFCEIDHNESEIERRRNERRSDTTQKKEIEDQQNSLENGKTDVNLFNDEHNLQRNSEQNVVSVDIVNKDHKQPSGGGDQYIKEVIQKENEMEKGYRHECDENSEEIEIMSMCNQIERNMKEDNQTQNNQDVQRMDDESQQTGEKKDEKMTENVCEEVEDTMKMNEAKCQTQSCEDVMKVVAAGSDGKATYCANHMKADSVDENQANPLEVSTDNDMEDIILSDEYTDEENDQRKAVEIIDAFKKNNKMPGNLNDANAPEEGYDEDEHDLESLKEIFQEAAEKRSRRQKVFSVEAKARFTLEELMNMRRKYKDFLEENELMQEMRNYMGVVAKSQKSRKIEVGPLKNFYEDLSDQRIEDGGIKTKIVTGKTSKNEINTPSKVMMKVATNRTIRKTIPICNQALTQLIKRVDQAQEKIDQKGSYLSEFFDDFDVYEANNLIRENMEFLHQHERLKTVYSFMLQAHIMKEIPPMDKELVQDIQCILKQKHGDTKNK